MENTPLYSIPAKYRKIENLHIVFWLIKDMCWAMLWKPLGLVMIVPTVSVAVLITWQTRKLKAELYHNLAVLFWIIANCYWMVTEFLALPDETRYYAAVPFSIGIVIIAAYYIRVLPAEKTEAMANAG
ncbi:hypothetical protein [Flavihumibacter petaseus]|uniref:Uncharacterized protein n=1 Tax=Flavihumibacter petaseus NBRC 106054 TaxID=1220578 RepID=A0A0E9N4U0_9BACT|nr:hypothetical protein [Flavihumibacter petaseus]GAO44818.1 hypothetical protein FPE01S_04_00610 [Flavihumibacter petaseus NBRC 106054]